MSEHDVDQPGPVRIRGLTGEDIAACAALAAAVDWNADTEVWQTMLRLGQPFAAERAGGRLVGTIVVIPFGSALATIAMMIVHPEVQRQGIGRALMEHALAASRSELHCLYATAVGERLYRPLGFTEAGASSRFEGEVTPLAAPPRADLRPMTGADLPRVAQLDEATQGAPRHGLLEHVFATRPAAWVIERGGRVRGFGMARQDAHVFRVGPIVAEDDGDAIAIAERLVDTGGQVLVDLEPGEQALRRWAEARGMRETHVSLRMTLGNGALPGARAQSRALAGRAFG